jgi:formate dehydrogenase
MEAALAKLDLLVCVDIYPSDTSAFAHYALPACTAFEKGGLHFLTSTFEPKPFVEWRQKVVEPRGHARPEWDIFKALSRSAGVPFLNDPLVDRIARVLERLGGSFSEEMLYRYVLGWRMPLGKLRRQPQGVTVRELPWGEFLQRRLATADRRMYLGVAELLEALRDAIAKPPATSPDFPLMLISGARRSASFNSWTHNIPALADKLDGNVATLAASDAAVLGVAEGQEIEIGTATGAIRIKATLSPDIRPGVVAVQQFWGHVYDNTMRHARLRPGVNVNHLHDDRLLDRFCGMPVFNGTPCRVRPL